jgi:hypothetical protein
MTTLADIITQPLPPIDALRGIWLAFDPALKTSLDQAQSDSLTHRVSPVFLTDGRAALCADLLSEIHPEGLFANQFARLDPANFEAVEVIDDATFRSLLTPPSDEI